MALTSLNVFQVHVNLPSGDVATFVFNNENDARFVYEAIKMHAADRVPSRLSPINPPRLVERVERELS